MSKRTGEYSLEQSAAEINNASWHTHMHTHMHTHTCTHTHSEQDRSRIARNRIPHEGEPNAEQMCESWIICGPWRGPVPPLLRDTGTVTGNDDEQV